MGASGQTGRYSAISLSTKPGWRSRLIYKSPLAAKLMLKGKTSYECNLARVSED
jgi:hypothetical protein